MHNRGPVCAELLELRKLPGGGRGAVYEPSRNRQSHLWAFSERADAHSIALKRVFLRSALPSTDPEQCYEGLQTLELCLCDMFKVCIRQPLAV